MPLRREQTVDHTVPQVWVEDVNDAMAQLETGEMI